MLGGPGAARLASPGFIRISADPGIQFRPGQDKKGRWTLTPNFRGDRLRHDTTVCAGSFRASSATVGCPRSSGLDLRKQKPNAEIIRRAHPEEPLEHHFGFLETLESPQAEA